MRVIKYIDGCWEVFHGNKETSVIGDSVIEVMEKYEEMIGQEGCAFVIETDHGKIVRNLKSMIKRIDEEEEGL